MSKSLFNAIAVILTIAAFIPYIRSIARGQTKPHVFSWIVWGLATTIVFFAQLADGAGVGAWSMGVSGAVTLYVAFLAARQRSDVSITKMDWVFFILAVASLPLWYWTSDPFWAVVILTIVDTLGFAPTFRKAYYKPYEEQMLLYVLMAIRNLISMAALEHYSWTTVLFPAITLMVSVIFMGMVMVRRTLIKPSAK